MKQRKNKKVYVIIVIIGVLFISSIITILDRNREIPANPYICIYQDGKLWKEIEISNIEEPYTITIEWEGGGYNILEIRNGAVGIVEASCPDKVCQKMGFISNSLMPITCLPNHLMICVVEQGSTEKIDGVVY